MINEPPPIPAPANNQRSRLKKQFPSSNKVLLDRSNLVENTACVDSKGVAADIGDSVHFDTPAQVWHGELFAKEWLGLAQGEY